MPSCFTPVRRVTNTQNNPGEFPLVKMPANRHNTVLQCLACDILRASFPTFLGQRLLPGRFLKDPRCPQHKLSFEDSGLLSGTSFTSGANKAMDFWAFIIIPTTVIGLFWGMHQPFVNAIYWLCEWRDGANINWGFETFFICAFGLGGWTYFLFVMYILYWSK